MKRSAGWSKRRWPAQAAEGDIAGEWVERERAPPADFKRPVVK